MKIINNSIRFSEKVRFWIINRLYLKLSFVLVEHNLPGDNLMDHFKTFLNDNGFELKKIYLIHYGKRRISAHCTKKDEDFFIKWEFVEKTKRNFSLNKEYEACTKYSKNSSLFLSPIDIGENFLSVPFLKNFISLKEYLIENKDSIKLSNTLAAFSHLFEKLCLFYRKNNTNLKYDYRSFINDVEKYKRRSLYFENQRMGKALMSSLIFYCIKKQYQDNYHDFCDLYKERRIQRAGFIHGDLHEENILINPENMKMIVIDLEDAEEGNYLFDISYLVVNIIRYLSLYGKSSCLKLIEECKKQIKKINASDILIFNKLLLFQIHLLILNHEDVYNTSLINWLKHKKVLLQVVKAISL